MAKRNNRSLKEAVAGMLYRFGFSAAALKLLLKLKKRHCILMYHRISDAQVHSSGENTEFESVSEDRFRMHLEVLKRFFCFVTLSECAKKSATSEKPLAAVTFDDGYKSVYEKALPVLRSLRVPATVFVTTGAVDTGSLIWTDMLTLLNRVTKEVSIAVGDKIYSRDSFRENGAAGEIKQYCKQISDADRRRLLAEIFRQAGVESERVPAHEGMLSWKEVSQLAEAGIEIGAHTLTHPVLSRCLPEEAKNEIFGSKERIESVLKIKVSSFCYPNGLKTDFNLETEGLVRKAGFLSAVTAEEGLATGSGDPYALPRIYLDTSCEGMVVLKLIRILLKNV